MVFGRKPNKNTEPTTDQVPTAIDLEAVEQYERLLRTASQDELLQVHTEAFEKLTPEQRDLMFDMFLRRAAAEDERPHDAEPRSLAGAATLIEQRKPGTLRRLFDDPNAGPLWTEPNHSIWTAFIGYALATQVGYSILLDADAAASPPYDPDAASGPDPNFDGYGDGFGGGFDGGYSGGFGGDGAGF